MVSELPKLGAVLKEGGEKWVVAALSQNEHGQTAVLLSTSMGGRSELVRRFQNAQAGNFAQHISRARRSLRTASF
jgi:hypothetical protein